MSKPDTFTTQIIELAKQGGTTPHEIAVKVGCSSVHVRRVCQMHGLLAVRHAISGEWFYPRTDDRLNPKDQRAIRLRTQERRDKLSASFDKLDALSRVNWPEYFTDTQTAAD